MTSVAALKYFDEKLSNFKQTSQAKSLIRLAKDGQRPEAIVVTCSDSRVAPEILFGADVGQLFVIRVAGNIVGSNELASIEFAALALNVPLCIVLGHSSCGAVSASVDWHLERKSPPTASLQSLVKEIEPSVAEAVASTKDSTSCTVKAATSENVSRVMKSISEKSPALKEKIRNGEFLVKGGVVDMGNVALNWLD